MTPMPQMKKAIIVNRRKAVFSPTVGASIITGNDHRRGAGVADRAGLENRCGRKLTEGSNPSLSACLPAAVTEVFVTAAVAFLGIPQSFPFVAFCGERVL